MIPEPAPGGRSRRRRALRGVAAGGVLAALLASAGCGSGTGPAAAVTTASAPAPGRHSLSPTPRPETLVAVLERHNGSRTADTVAIVGLDGYARARATFQPRALPDVGRANPVLQPEARVVGGAVYYADGLGVVRRLAPGNGPPRTEATFPLTSDRQSVAFAVSPDGTRLIATVLTVSPVIGADPAALPPWHVDVETAEAGGPTVTVRSIDLPASEPGTAPRTLQVVGWDATAAVALTDAVGAEQQDDSGGLWQGHPAHLDSHGLAAAPLGGPTCGASHEEPDGLLLCADVQGMTTTLRRPDGSTVHRFERTGTGPWLSPDGGRLAYGGAAGPAVQSLDGSTTALAAGFTPSGWLDGGTVIGTTRGEELAYVALGAPLRTVDIGFPGSFVGVVQG